jgi:hypothetical protein
MPRFQTISAGMFCSDDYLAAGTFFCYFIFNLIDQAASNPFQQEVLTLLIF